MVRNLLADGSTQVTRLGKLYFKGGETEYIASAPVIISGRSAKREVQSGGTKLPVDVLGLSWILGDNSEPEERRITRVKSYVLQQLQIRSGVGGRTVLMETSGDFSNMIGQESAKPLRLRLRYKLTKPSRAR